MSDSISQKAQGQQTTRAAVRPVSPRGLSELPAAEYLGVKPRKLRRWRELSPDDPGEKGPPYVRLGYRTVIYLIDDLDAYLEQKRSETLGALRSG